METNNREDFNVNTITLKIPNLKIPNSTRHTAALKILLFTKTAKIKEDDLFEIFYFPVSLFSNTKVDAADSRIEFLLNSVCADLHGDWMITTLNYETL